MAAAYNEARSLVGKIRCVEKHCRLQSKTAQPDVEGPLLIGSQGSRPRAHTVVHHLLPQVVDFGLETAVLCKTRGAAIYTDSQA